MNHVRVHDACRPSVMGHQLTTLASSLMPHAALNVPAPTANEPAPAPWARYTWPRLLAFLALLVLEGHLLACHPCRPTILALLVLHVLLVLLAFLDRQAFGRP
eukprot:229973-Prymnesium_polylepis.1